jgi:hypothetical protein
MTALLIAALLAAEPPADAPLDLPGRSVRLVAGQPAPFPGRLLSDAEHIKSEAACADDHAKLAKAEKSLLVSPLGIVALVVGGLAVGAAVGAGVAIATRR